MNEKIWDEIVEELVPVIEKVSNKLGEEERVLVGIDGDGYVKIRAVEEQVAYETFRARDDVDFKTTITKMVV